MPRAERHVFFPSALSWPITRRRSSARLILGGLQRRLMGFDRNRVRNPVAIELLLKLPESVRVLSFLLHLHWLFTRTLEISLNDS